MHIDLHLDAAGLLCPEPVMLLHNHMASLRPGQVLRLRATDPSTCRDVPKFCTFLGHELLEQEEQGAHYYYCIRKGAGNDASDAPRVVLDGAQPGAASAEQGA